MSWSRAGASGFHLGHPSARKRNGRKGDMCRMKMVRKEDRKHFRGRHVACPVSVSSEWNLQIWDAHACALSLNQRRAGKTSRDCQWRTNRRRSAGARGGRPTVATGDRSYTIINNTRRLNFINNDRRGTSPARHLPYVSFFRLCSCAHVSVIYPVPPLHLCSRT